MAADPHLGRDRQPVWGESDRLFASLLPYTLLKTPTASSSFHVAR